MPPVTLTHRRWLAVGLLSIAILTVAVTVAANADGDGGFAWQCGERSYICMSDKRGGHIHLRLFAHPFLGVVLAAGLSAVAAHLAVRGRGPRVAAKTLSGVVAGVALLIGGPFASYGGALSVSQEGMVATAQSFKLVSYRSPNLFHSDFIVLRLQSREGLASRESSENLACFIDEGSGSGPAWIFAQARFVGEEEVALSAKDGTTWRIRFDRRTLASVNPLDRCTDAPDPYVDW
jgi:hypothetical protein